MMKQVYFLLILTLIITTTFAQDKKKSSSNEDDASNEALEYSRPGKYHQLLADLVGTWTFKDISLEWVDSVTNKVTEEIRGTAVRKSFANGRFLFCRRNC